MGLIRKPRLEHGILQREITYIDGFPRWGCFEACIGTAIQRALGRKLSQSEMLAWHKACVQHGCIRHNDVPTNRNSNEWWRCYIVDPVAAFNIGMQLFDGPRIASTDDSANIIFYRWKTPWGYHFTYGSPDRELHDPDPGLKLLMRDGQRGIYVGNVR